MKSLYNKDDFISQTFLIQWSCIAIAAGVVGNLCVQGLFFLVALINDFLISISSVPLFLWPLAGTIPVGFVVYNLAPGAMGEGIPSYLESVRRGGGYLSFRETVFKIFAVEIILRTNMRYKHLFPAILASTSSVFLARHLGLEPILHFPLVHGILDVRILPVLLLTIFAAGFTGKLFIFCYAGISHLFQRNHKISKRRRTLYMMTGSLIASIVFWINPSLMGISSDLFSAILSGARIPLYGDLPHSVSILKILFVMFILKGMANIFTVGSGMSAGFAGPAILMGLLLGAGFAEIFRIPFGSVEYFALLAAGFAAYFSSIMNTPIASAILTIELFGMYYSLPAGLAAVIGFMVNQEHTLYDLVLEEREEKRSEEYSDTLDKK